MAAPSIGRQQIRTPPFHARLDPDNPITRRIVGCHIPAGLLGAVDLAGGPPLPPVGNPALALGAMGRQWTTDVSTRGYQLTVGATHKLAVQPPYTVMWVGTTNGTPQSDSTFYGTSPKNTGAPYGAAYICGNDGAGSFRWALYYNDGSFGETQHSSTPAAGLNVLIATMSPTSSRTWQNGTPGTAGVGVAAGDVSYSSSAYCAFGIGAAGGNSAGVSIMGAMWARELTVGEIVQLSRNPFCFLRW